MSVILQGLLGLFSSIFFIVVALILFGMLIVIHELGHYFFGKIFKFKINEFSIGFGKAIVSKKLKNGEIFSWRWIPLGGYCAFEGEDEESENEGAFNRQAWWKRIFVLLGGVLFNFVSAVIVAIPLLMVMGNAIPKIMEVDAGSINTNIQAGDIVRQVDGTKPTYLNGGLIGLTHNFEAGEEFTLTVERDGELIDLIVEKYETTQTVDGEEKTVSVLGVRQENIKYGFFQSVAMSVPFSVEIGVECLEILGKLIIGQYGLRDIGGPVTTVKAIAKVSSISMLNLLLFFPIIAINLAVFNALPIPALDGGRVVFVLIEAIRKKPINREIEAKIHFYGIMVLFAFIIIVDLLQLFVFKVI